MGGHVLKKTFTRRYAADEYDALSIKMMVHVTNLFGTKIHVVRAYGAKESHGDMDILVLNDGSLGDINAKISEYFKPGQIVRNGNVYSFDHEELQIDLILTTPENWDSSLVFFDYDPSGNLMGKTAHKFGLKYGFAGLMCPYRSSSGREVADIFVSKDSRRIFEFMGYDYDEYSKGFDTEPQIFEYVMGSMYFDPQNFMMENLNHIDKKRNRKRPSYRGFLEYINAEVKVGRQWRYTFRENKETYLPVISETFPEADIYGEIKKCKDAEERRRVIAGKFNGDMVIAMFSELSREKLGEYISGFRQHITQVQRTLGLEGTDRQLFNDYVYNCSQELIEKDMREYRYPLY